MRDHRATILAGALVVFVLVLAFVLAGPSQHDSGGGALEVRVHDGDGAVYCYPLDVDGEFVFHTSYGTNAIRIEGGSVRMAGADCPNLSCTNQAALTAPGAQIVCLPHRLWVEVAPQDGEGASGLDEERVVWSGDKGAGASGALDTVAR